MKIGDWVSPTSKVQGIIPKSGHPMMAASKAKWLNAVRVFFKNGQDWEWFPRTFDPYRWLVCTPSMRAEIGPKPRVIADAAWAKLLWAGLNLTSQDVLDFVDRPQQHWQKGLPFYPLEMLKALALVWLFGGLRSDEIRRLRVGCITWQSEGTPIPLTVDNSSTQAVCILEVPVNKTSGAFQKPVDRVVGEAIEVWEAIRPDNQPDFIDPKTHELADLLFYFKGKPIGKSYLNLRLIPLLCHKAGVPRKDARGKITSHRARSTIASQLFNAKDPLSLFDLQAWLGHRLLSSTQYYAQPSLTKVTRAYQKAGYFERNARAIQVLIDQQVVQSGEAARGVPWKSYDLGHGFCNYEFFDQCPHRMACAKCAFYVPKGSSKALLLEGKANLLWLLQEIPLNDEEREAVEDGVQAMERLCERLANVPTPSGLTPNQINTQNRNS
jgi:integrase